MLTVLFIYRLNNIREGASSLEESNIATHPRPHLGLNVAHVTVIFLRHHSGDIDCRRRCFYHASNMCVPQVRPDEVSQAHHWLVKCRWTEQSHELLNI